MITSISSYFSATAAVSILGQITVRSQLYRSASPATNIFQPIAQTLIQLAPNLSTPISLGMISRGQLANLAISVSQGDRLLMVFSATASGLTPIGSVTGYASAGVAIS